MSRQAGIASLGIGLMEGPQAIRDTPYTAITAGLFRVQRARAGDLAHSGLLVELECRTSGVS